MTEPNRAKEVSQANKAYWDEPCGTNAYEKLGFKSHEEFDHWYFNFYPYLEEHIPFDSVRGQRVLEVGLGMGTVSERLAKEGADFHGMDIAEGPVKEVRQRLERIGSSGEANVGDVLDCPWEDGFFDVVVSIGCLHHTGNMTRAITELVRVLKPGGTGVFMVYNAYSYRQWLSSPLNTMRSFMSEKGDAKSRQAAESERAKYDHNLGGTAAPCTEFMGRRSIDRLMDTLGADARVQSENIGAIFMFPLPRNLKLKLFGSFLGLDLYVRFSKHEEQS